MSDVKFKLQNLQFVYFLDGSYIPDKTALLTKLKAVMGGGNEIILPIPNDAPPDIPLIILQSPDKYEIKIARGRVDFHYKGSATSTCDQVRSEFLLLNEKLFEILSNDTAFKIQNIGFIIRSLNEEIALINSKIASMFSQDTIFDFQETSDILIRNLKKETLVINGESIKFNQIALFGTVIGSSGKRIISLEFDMNTFPKDQSVLIVNKAFLQEFVKQDVAKNNQFVEWLTKILSS